MSQFSQSDAALVLFSGGQDSTTCLAWALARFARVEMVGFDYGQRHRVELECRARIAERLRREFPKWGERLGEDHLVDLGVLGQVSDTALTRDSAIAFEKSGLPNTFVPGRNILFFTFAAAIGYRRGLKHLVGGMCETDYSGYPDCRDDTLKALQVALNLGMEQRFVVDTPLMWIDKARTFALADDIGGDRLMRIVLEHTHSCYMGDRTHRHDWGYGCGTCPACELRSQGWLRYSGKNN
jgi:7-cyano-7-deazaguanine synthase